VQWLSCIKQKAAPQGDPASVMTAWGPADCREYCGTWPVTSGMEGNSSRGAGNASRAASFLSLRASSRDDCLESCDNFQHSLSSCVATVLFEPGKVVAMGMPDGAAAKKSASQICTSRNTSCMPDLPFEHQKCISARAGRVLGKTMSKETEMACERVKMDMEDCKDCPQLSPEYTSHYHSFVGGCMDQLNAYWAATHPNAGPHAAIPGASGCTVHA